MLQDNQNEIKSIDKIRIKKYQKKRCDKILKANEQEKWIHQQENI